jgi:hypothetical protein
MSQESGHPIKPATIALIVTSVLTIVLGIAVAVAFLSQPKTITVTITAPAGGVVLCDLVVDGRPQSRRDTAPVTYSLRANNLEFAVIPETADAGQVSVEFSARGGHGSVSGEGVRGTASVGALGGGVSLGPMSSRHVDTMRFARAKESAESDAAQNDRSVRNAEPADSPPAR